MHNWDTWASGINPMSCSLREESSHFALSCSLNRDTYNPIISLIGACTRLPQAALSNRSPKGRAHEPGKLFVPFSMMANMLSR